jgi:hypothetical protein
LAITFNGQLENNELETSVDEMRKGKTAVGFPAKPLSNIVSTGKENVLLSLSRLRETF